MLKTKRTTFIRKPPGYFAADDYRRNHASRTGFERHRPAATNHSTGISILDPSIRSLCPISPIFDPPRFSFFLREASSPPPRLTNSYVTVRRQVLSCRMNPSKPGQYATVLAFSERPQSFALDRSLRSKRQDRLGDSGVIGRFGNQDHIVLARHHEEFFQGHARRSEQLSSCVHP